MRIPHYLVRAPSGMYHFRRRMPSCLHALVGRPVIKKSLLTRDVGVARDLALKLWRAYDELHQHVRKAAMAGMTKDAKLLIERLKKSGTQYRLITKRDGTVEVEVTGPEDHALAMEAIARIGNLYKEPYVQRVLAEGNAPPQSPAPAHTASAPARTIRAAPAPGEAAPDARRFPDKPIGRAIDEWEADITSGTRPKTLVIKRMAVADFVKSFGTKRPVHDVTRVEIGKWVSELRARNLATPTIVNRISYLKGFLDWSKGKGFIDFPRNDSPASGQVTYKTREKRLRKKHGYRAFNDAQLKVLFAPTAFGKLTSSTAVPSANRWSL